MAVSKRTRFEVLRRDNYTCRYCRADDQPLTVDHVTPIALGGTDKPSNIVAACRDCNAGKPSAAPDGETLAMLSDAEIIHERARAKVLARIQEEQGKREADHTEFLGHWRSWDPNRIHLSPTWRQSIDQWRTRGLSMARIVEAYDIAMGKDHLPTSAVWPYMAKIAWNWIGDIEDAIKLEVHSLVPPEEVEKSPLEEQMDGYLVRFGIGHIASAVAAKALLDFHCDGWGEIIPERFLKVPSLDELVA